MMLTWNCTIMEWGSLSAHLHHLSCLGGRVLSGHTSPASNTHSPGGRPPQEKHRPTRRSRHAQRLASMPFGGGGDSRPTQPAATAQCCRSGTRTEPSKHSSVPPWHASPRTHRPRTPQSLRSVGGPAARSVGQRGRNAHLSDRGHTFPTESGARLAMRPALRRA